MPYKDKEKERKREIRRRKSKQYKEYQREYQRRWKLKNKSRWKEISSKSELRPERKEYIRNWQRNSKNFKKTKERFIKNGGMRRWEKEKKQKDKNYVISKRIRYRIRDAINAYAYEGKNWKAKDIGINYEKIIEHLKPFPKDISKYHIDHIKPLCSFNFINEDGSTNLKEVRRAFAPENHQWLLAKENIVKGQEDKKSKFIYQK